MTPPVIPFHPFSYWQAGWLTFDGKAFLFILGSDPEKKEQNKDVDIRCQNVLRKIDRDIWVDLTSCECWTFIQQNDSLFLQWYKMSMKGSLHVFNESLSLVKGHDISCRAITKKHTVLVTALYVTEIWFKGPFTRDVYVWVFVLSLPTGSRKWKR